MSAIDALLTAVVAQNKQAQVYSDNLTKANIDGSTRKEVQITPLIVGGDSAGVQVSKVQRTIDELLQAKVWGQNSKTSSLSTMNEFLQRMQYVFGAAGQSVTFVHRMSDVARTMDAIAQDPSGINKINAVQALNRLCASVNTVGSTIQDLRTDTDMQINNCINDLNGYLTQVANLNVQISNDANSGTGVTLLEDQRDLFLQKISSIVDIQIKDDAYQKKVFTGAGYSLIFQGVPLPMSYTQSVTGAPGVALSPIMLSANNITNTIQGGKLAALIKLRDTILPNIQQQMDEFTRNLRDSINATHNQLSSTNPSATLTGTTGVVDISTGTVQALTTTTTLSGTGTLRIGVVDSSTGKFTGSPLQYRDINLGALGTGGNFTAQQLLDAVNIPAMGVTASLVNGALQLTTTTPTQGCGVVLGGISGSTPMVSYNTGSGYQAANALGFSHYFGLNNLIETGNQLYYPSNQPAGTSLTNGISNILSVRNSILNNAAALCTTQLYNDATTPPASTTIAVPPRDTSQLISLSKTITKTPMTFVATGGNSQALTTLVDYGSRIIEINSTLTKNNETDYQQSKFVYDDLAKQNYEYSGVDVQKEFYNLYLLRQARGLVAKAINLNNEINEAVNNLIK